MATVMLSVIGLAAPALVHAGPAQAAAIHDLRGHFAAFTLINTIDNPDMRPGTLDITAQLGSVVAGRADLGGRSGAVAGTVSSTDEVNLVGLGGPDTFSVRGHIAHPGDIVPCIFEGGYRAADGDGHVVAVHQVPVTGAPSIGGAWTGAIGDPGIRGQLTATFTQSRTGALTGRIEVRLFNPQPDPPGFQLTIVGQTAWDGSQAAYLVVGGAQAALTTLELHPGHAADGTRTLGGPLRLIHADGTVQDATIELRPEG